MESKTSVLDKAPLVARPTDEVVAAAGTRETEVRRLIGLAGNDVGGAVSASLFSAPRVPRLETGLGQVARRMAQEADIAMMGRKATEAGKNGPDAAKAVATEAKEKAAEFARTDPRAGARLLDAAVGGLMKAGRYGEAKALAQEMKNEPYASAPLDLLQGKLDRGKVDMKPDGFSYGDPEKGETATYFKGTRLADGSMETKFQMTAGQLAEKRLMQAEQLQRMSDKLGGPVDPQDLGKVKEYFQKLAKDGASTSQIREELQSYLASHYEHPGGVSWAKDAQNRFFDAKGSDRLGRLQDLFRDQPTDAAGRRIIDCEGFSYLAQELLRDIPGKDGKPRFEFVHANSGNHVIVGVFERGAPKGKDASFYVSNAEAIPFPEESKDFPNPVTRRRDWRPGTPEGRRLMMKGVKDFDRARTDPDPRKVAG